MDGRTAAINVFGGAMLGASVPFVAAIALSQAMIDFRLLDHLFTLVFLAIACGAIGVVINLPWGGLGPSPETATIGDGYASEDYEFDAGEDEETFTFEREAHSEQHQRRGPGAPPKRYAMSRLAALRTLELPHDADDDEIREAYRRMAKASHPDTAAAAGSEAVDEATRRFVRIREAYEVLIDED